MDINQLVSIIIPTYNRGHLIRQCIESALDQTYRNIEVIVVDDGSTDETRSIIQRIEDARLTYIYQENRGRSNARNKGILHSSGSIISFLDSDDRFHPNKTQRQLEYMRDNPGFRMTYTSAWCVGEDGTDLHHRYRANRSGDIYEHIAFFVPHTIALPTVLVHRDILDSVGLFDESMDRFEDVDLWRRIAKSTMIGGLDEILCTLITHGGNELRSQDPNVIINSIEYYLEKILLDDLDHRNVFGDRFEGLISYYVSAFEGVDGWRTFAARLLGLKNRYRGRIAPDRTNVPFTESLDSLVSIVIPVYNGSRYVAEAIDSALAQTYRNIEVIVVNDGSNDGGQTDKVVQSYGDRVRYIRKSNGGVADALNVAVAAANGKFICWLSHDDLYLPEKVASNMDWYLGQNETDVIIYSDYAVFTDDPKCAERISLGWRPPDQFRYWLTVENKLHGCTLFIPKSAFERSGGFDTKRRTTQDYHLWYRMAKNFKFVYQPEVLVLGRSHPDQGTNAIPEIVLQECDQLLWEFVSGLTTLEAEVGTCEPEVHGYEGIRLAMEDRGFTKAQKLAEKFIMEKAV